MVSTDILGGTTTHTSASSIILNVDDAPVGKPVISVVSGGEFMEGNTLEVDVSGISDEDGINTGIGFTYQWYRNSASLVNETNVTYILTQADVNNEIKVEVTYKDLYENEHSILSDSTIPIKNKNDDPTGKPIISVVDDGEYKEGNTLQVDVSGISDLDGINTVVGFTYQWYRNSESVVDETNTTYLLTQDDVNKRISVKVSYVDLFENPHSIFSDETTEIAYFNRKLFTNDEVTDGWNVISSPFNSQLTSGDNVTIVALNNNENVSIALDAILETGKIYWIKLIVPSDVTNEEALLIASQV